MLSGCRCLSVFCLLGLMLVFGTDSVTVERSLAFQPAGQMNFLGGRKTVTVYADNGASASAQAASKNPGWTVAKVKKVNSDPKSRAYQVTLTK